MIPCVLIVPGNCYASVRFKSTILHLCFCKLLQLFIFYDIKIILKGHQGHLDPTFVLLRKNISSFCEETNGCNRQIDKISVMTGKSEQKKT